MPMTRIWDLSYELVDAETIRVEQSAGAGEAYAVDLHSVHVRLLASELGLMQGDPDAWRRVATLERRLRVLRDRIETLDGRLWAVPVYPPGSDNSDPDLIYSDCTLDLANEFCADLPNGADEQEATERQATPRNADSGGETHGETQTKPTAKRNETRGFSGQAGLALEVR